MNAIFGSLRTHVAARHAIIAPAGFVPSRIHGIENATPYVVISPAMGARFTQLLVEFQDGGTMELPPDGNQIFGYVMNGAAALQAGSRTEQLVAGGFFFVPSDTAWSLRGPVEGSRITFFIKPYVPLAGENPPSVITGHSRQVTAEPFLGDKDARLQVLLPDTLSFDMAVNIFNYEPGARLPSPETHIMEHGLILLDGEGVYRLEDAWYPVTAGDCIWMGPYCPQWFVAMGRIPTRYLYYKDINRHPMHA